MRITYLRRGAFPLRYGTGGNRAALYSLAKPLSVHELRWLTQREKEARMTTYHVPDVVHRDRRGAREEGGAAMISGDAKAELLVEPHREPLRVVLGTGRDSWRIAWRAPSGAVLVAHVERCCEADARRWLRNVLHTAPLLVEPLD